MIPLALFYLALTAAILVAIWGFQQTSQGWLQWALLALAIVALLVAALETPVMTRWFMCQHGDAVRHCYTALWTTS